VPNLQDAPTRCKRSFASDFKRTKVTPSTVAAVFVELFTASSGTGWLHPIYYKSIIEWASKNDVVVIVDEAMTGFRRMTGSFLACNVDVYAECGSPDMVVLGKVAQCGMVLEQSARDAASMGAITFDSPRYECVASSFVAATVSGLGNPFGRFDAGVGGRIAVLPPADFEGIVIEALTATKMAFRGGGKIWFVKDGGGGVTRVCNIAGEDGWVRIVIPYDANADYIRNLISSIQHK
jgi:hypothetical protein